MAEEQKKSDESLGAIGCVMIIGLALALGGLYLLVRFVKWAWTD